MQSVANGAGQGLLPSPGTVTGPRSSPMRFAMSLSASLWQPKAMRKAFIEGRTDGGAPRHRPPHPLQEILEDGHIQCSVFLDRSEAAQGGPAAGRNDRLRGFDPFQCQGPAVQASRGDPGNGRRRQRAVGLTDRSRSEDLPASSGHRRRSGPRDTWRHKPAMRRAPGPVGSRS